MTTGPTKPPHSGGKTPSKSDIRTSKSDIRIDSEDFAASMARLAELAAKDIVTVDKDEKQKTLEEEALLEYLTPKRKKKTEEEEDNTKKVRLNPYVGLGILVVLLSFGFLAIPRIVQFLDEQEGGPDQRKMAARQHAKEDKKMTTYSLGDAIKDIQQRELTPVSVAELADRVAEINLNLDFGEQSQGGWFSLLSTTNSVQLSGEGIVNEETGEVSAEEHPELQLAAFDPENPDTSIFDPVSTDTWQPVEFDWASSCDSADTAYTDDAAFYRDIYEAMGLTAVPAGTVACD